MNNYKRQIAKRRGLNKATKRKAGKELIKNSAEPVNKSMQTVGTAILGFAANWDETAKRMGAIMVRGLFRQGDNILEADTIE